MNNFYVITQCRLGSERLKNKIILKLGDKTILDFFFDRLRKIRAKKIICAVAKEKNNSKLIKILKANKMDYYVGSKKNVLQRIFYAAKKFKCKNVIRITSDCPLIDPALVNKGIEIFKKKKLNYLSNNLDPSWPHGLDFEIFTFDSLQEAYYKSKTNSEKEHVTKFIRNNSKFKKFNLKSNVKLNRYFRWTLDTNKDYLFIKKIYNTYLKKNNFNTSWKKLHSYLLKNQNIQNINASDHHFYF